MQLSGIAQLEHRYPGAAVLTAWPMTDELTRPELGYVKRPWDPGDVDRIDDFSAAQIAKAAAEPEKYSAALVFSTKYDPPSPLLTLGAKSKQLDERYFGMHHDLPRSSSHNSWAARWFGSGRIMACGSLSSASIGSSKRI